jgi:hypothetical protein
MTDKSTHRKGLEWRFNAAPARTDIRFTCALRAWHRAKLLGFVLDSVTIDGRPLDPVELERLNLWVEALGAWRCSLLPPHKAAAVLSKVISGDLLRVGLGAGGGGRWSAGCSSEIFLRDSGEGVQGEFRF